MHLLRHRPHPKAFDISGVSTSNSSLESLELGQDVGGGQAGDGRRTKRLVALTGDTVAGSTRLVQLGSGDRYSDGTTSATGQRQDTRESTNRHNRAC